MDSIVSIACRGMLVLTALCLAGCAPSGGANLASVKGTVKLDGQPVDQGRILFEPAAGNTGPTAGSSITNGTYEIPAGGGAPHGKNIVRINASKPTGKKIKSSLSDDMLDEMVEAIPAKYNTQSTLERDVQAGDNEFNFELESK